MKLSLVNTVLASSLSLFITIGNAQPITCEQSTDANHFVVGVDLAHSMFSGSSNYTGQINGNPYAGAGASDLPIMAGSVSHKQLDTTKARLSLGYQFALSKLFFVGIDGYMSLADKKSTLSQQSENGEWDGFDKNISEQITAKIETKGLGYGIEFTPGITINDKLSAAAIVGYGWSPYTLTANTLFDFDYYQDNPSIFKKNAQKDSNGAHVILGLKAMYELSTSLSVSFSYQYNTFESQSLSAYSNDVVLSDDKTESATSSASIQGLKSNSEVGIGLNYRF